MGRSCVGRSWEMKCVDRSCVGWSENWSDERVDWRNEGDRPEKWADQTVFMNGSKWETEKENSPCVECVDRGASSVDRDWEMSGSELGASLLGVWIVLFGLVCGSELVKLCVRLRKDQCVWERSGKCLKWKFGLKIISVGFGLFYGQTENIFNLTQFTIPTKHAIFRKMISEFRFQSKQTDPKISMVNGKHDQ